jgi:hypothetical protein
VGRLASVVCGKAKPGRIRKKMTTGRIICFMSAECKIADLYNYILKEGNNAFIA